MFGDGDKGCFDRSSVSYEIYTEIGSIELILLFSTLLRSMNRWIVHFIPTGGRNRSDPSACKDQW